MDLGSEFSVAISTEALVELYLRREQSPPQIAELVGHSETWVRARLKKAGVPLRGRSDAQRLNYRTGRIKLEGGHSPQQTRAANDYLASHPEIRRQLASAAGKRRWRAHSRFVACEWCGDKIKRWLSQLRKCPHVTCNYSHSAKARLWRQHHSDEPRPLILARLREMAGDERNVERLHLMAAEIGAADIEVAEILFPSR